MSFRKVFKLSKNKRKRKIRKNRILLSLCIVAVIVFGIYNVLNLAQRALGYYLPASYSVSSAPHRFESDNEYIEKIKQTYTMSEESEHIIENIDSYPTSLLDSLLKNPEMLSFVAGYTAAEQHGFENAENIDVSADCTPGKIPLFIQWDERWGYENYGTDLMALNACGPTCMAMIYVGLTGDMSENPLSIAQMCIENNYYYPNQGTSTELITYGADQLGLSSAELSLSADALLESLAAGHPVMANVGPGDFTTYGHYIVLTGIDENGRVTVNDPNSPNKSVRTWDAQRIVDQSYSLWSVWRE